MGSKIGAAPVTRSPMRWPAPGPIPKPWPENPAARMNPGMPGASPMPDTPSGALSTNPAQALATLAGRSAGSRSIARRCISLSAAGSGRGPRAEGRGLSCAQTGHSTVKQNPVIPDLNYCIHVNLDLLQLSPREQPRGKWCIPPLPLQRPAAGRWTCSDRS